MENYDRHYSQESFWEKLKKQASKAGKKVVYSALIAFYALENPETPLGAKMKIYGALGYLIFPIDLVPDFVPVAGYGDDLVALLYTIAQVAAHINKDVRTKALKKSEDWFGPISESDKDIIDVEAQIIEVEKNLDAAAATDEYYRK